MTEVVLIFLDKDVVKIKNLCYNEVSLICPGVERASGTAAAVPVLFIKIPHNDYFCPVVSDCDWLYNFSNVAILCAPSTT